MTEEKEKLIFCYWAPRGLGEPARMLLEYCGVAYENRVVKNREEWNAIKDKQGLDFPNLPFIIDGDVKLSESWAIYKYIAKKGHGLMPQTAEEEREGDMLHGVINDFRNAFSSKCYDPEFYSLVDGILEKQHTKLVKIEKFLTERKFLLGDRLTYIDFVLYETLDHHRLFSPGILEKYPNIEEYMKRFQSLDQIAAYFSSGRYHLFPITGPLATWGGKDHNDLRK